MKYPQTDSIHKDVTSEDPYFYFFEFRFNTTKKSRLLFQAISTLC